MLKSDLMEFSRVLLEWYQKNRRDLPWRNTTDPYLIWVSEVILQQTRVGQGTKYYLRFIEEFPTISHLANANEDKVLKVWQGLGYYTRARNLQKGARWVIEKHNGVLPKSYSDLLHIPGLGPYSAGAIASFAFNIPVPAIDGNVYRVISRFFGLFDSPFTAKGKGVYYQIVHELMPTGKANLFNQALLDFGALQCVPLSPFCKGCPFNTVCYAFRNNLVSKLPIKAAKLKVRDRYLTFIIIKCKEYTFLSKREGKDIWQSLYQFPLIETDGNISLEEMIALPQWRRLFGKGGVYINHFTSVIPHKLSHQNLHVRFLIVEINKPNSVVSRHYSIYRIAEVGNLSVPIVIHNFMAAEPFEKYMINSDKENSIK